MGPRFSRPAAPGAIGTGTALPPLTTSGAAPVNGTPTAVSPHPARLQPLARARADVAPTLPPLTSPSCSALGPPRSAPQAPAATSHGAPPYADAGTGAGAGGTWRAGTGTSVAPTQGSGRRVQSAGVSDEVASNSGRAPGSRRPLGGGAGAAGTALGVLEEDAEGTRARAAALAAAREAAASEVAALPDGGQEKKRTKQRKQGAATGTCLADASHGDDGNNDSGAARRRALDNEDSSSTSDAGGGGGNTAALQKEAARGTVVMPAPEPDTGELAFYRSLMAAAPPPASRPVTAASGGIAAASHSLSVRAACPSPQNSADEGAPKASPAGTLPPPQPVHGQHIRARPPPASRSPSLPASGASAGPGGPTADEEMAYYRLLMEARPVVATAATLALGSFAASTAGSRSAHHARICPDLTPSPTILLTCMSGPSASLECSFPRLTLNRSLAGYVCLVDYTQACATTCV